MGEWFLLLLIYFTVGGVFGFVVSGPIGLLLGLVISLLVAISIQLHKLIEIINSKESWLGANMGAFSTISYALNIYFVLTLIAVLFTGPYAPVVAIVIGVPIHIIILFIEVLKKLNEIDLKLSG